MLTCAICAGRVDFADGGWVHREPADCSQVTVVWPEPVETEDPEPGVATDAA